MDMVEPPAARGQPNGMEACRSRLAGIGSAIPVESLLAGFQPRALQAAHEAAGQVVDAQLHARRLHQAERDAGAPDERVGARAEHETRFDAGQWRVDGGHPRVGHGVHHGAAQDIQQAVAVGVRFEHDLVDRGGVVPARVADLHAQ